MSEPVHYYCDGRVLMRDGMGVEAETCPDFECERYFERAIAVATGETYELRGRSR